MTHPQPADQPAATPAAPPRRRRRPGKWTALAAFWTVQAVVVYFAALLWTVNSFEDSATRPWGQWHSPADVLHAATDADSLLIFGIVTAIVTALQAVILLPVRRPGPVRERGAALWASIAGVGLTIGAAWGALVLALVSLVYLVGTGEVAWFTRFVDDLGVGWGILVLPILPGWIVGTLVIAAFCRRGPRESTLARLSVRVLQGTAIEVAAIIPLDVMIRRRTDCYCETGTFWALTLCGTVGAVLTGPAILLPIIARRRRRWYADRCEVCGYDMRGLRTADRCPECGTGWGRPSSDPVEKT